MSVTIYKYGTTAPLVTVEPDTSSQQTVQLMNEDKIVLNVVSLVKIEWHIGDYCTWFGKLYQINVFPPKTETDEGINYTVTMESEMYDLTKVQLLFLNSNNVFTDAKFPFRGTARDLGDLIVYNMKRRYPLADWKLGSVIETDFVDQTFAGNNCMEALKTAATIFKTEYLVEGKTINLYQRQTSSGLVFRRGQNEALLNITEQNQDNSNIITRLYVFGSSKNLTNVYRSGSPALRIGDVNYVEKNVDLYRVFEQTVFFDGTTNDKSGSPLPEIFPHRTGTVSAVADPFHFSDGSIDFDLNDPAILIPGVIAQVVFNTGLLSGYTFNISSFDNATKTVTINANTDQPSLIVPSADLLPVVGDKYVFVNINMPQPYIDEAEADLKTAGLQYLDKNAVPQLAYTGDCNSLWFQKNNVNLQIGQTVEIVGIKLGIDVVTRIVSFTRNIRNPYIYTIQLADTVKPNSIIVQLLNGL